MEFDIRAISLVESVAADARRSVDNLVGQRIVFSAGLSYSITLPANPENFMRIPKPERTLCALDTWARLYRYPDDAGDVIHVLAHAETESEDLAFYRIDLMQPRGTRSGPRLPVEILGGQIMDFDCCTEWLIKFAADRAARADEALRLFTLSRPAKLAPSPVRIAWVGPEILGGVHAPIRLAVVGKVFGAEIFHIPTLPFRDAQNHLTRKLPLDAVLICRRSAAHLNANAVPQKVPRDLIFFYDGNSAPELEQMIHQAIFACRNQIVRHAGAESQLLLKLMARAMLSHDKIGQFNHCPKETLLKCIRARRMNVPAAERIIDENSEVYLGTKESEAMFLWKAHNDGRQYFLNPSRVEQTRLSLNL